MADLPSGFLYRPELITVEEEREFLEGVAKNKKKPAPERRGLFVSFIWAHLDSNQGPTGYEPVALTS
jgi:hypothetical protein